MMPALEATIDEELYRSRPPPQHGIAHRHAASVHVAHHFTKRSFSRQDWRCAAAQVVSHRRSQSCPADISSLTLEQIFLYAIKQIRRHGHWPTRRPAALLTSKTQGPIAIVNKACQEPPHDDRHNAEGTSSLPQGY